MKVHIVFAHVTHDSFTGALLDAFVQGLDEAGHEHTISDLYAMDFNPLMSVDEYHRESSYAAHVPVPEDIRQEQAKLNAADVWAFVYPVWWTDVPAILKGWFDRVWTVAFAYEPEMAEDGRHPTRVDVPQLRVAEQVVVLCSAGHSERKLRESGCWQAMETTMLTDRIFNRARRKQFMVFGGGADLTAMDWALKRTQDLASAYQTGLDLGRL
ncbi:MAG: NAD(P)H-dependent oxidoreductase [Propionibacteriaceae bacterium]|nr:NAD(P)H-dependent oxidoreductase [Propionibacteriaceae bacterium]